MKKTLINQFHLVQFMKKNKSPEDYLFVAGLFLGLGIGFIYMQIPAGVLIGMGVGFAATGIVKLLRKQGKLK